MVIKMEDEDYMRFLNNQYVHENEIIDTTTKPLSQSTEDIDPAYKMFLEHLREDGKSYVFEMINGDNDMPSLIKYEGEDDLSENNEADTKTSSGDIPLEGRDDSATKKGQKRRRFWPKSGEGVNKQSESSMVDESYQTFLSHLKWEGGSMVLEFGSLSITYDGERESTISSDILAPESNVKSDELSLVPYKSPEPDITVCEDSNMASLQQCELFKTKLMGTLDKPYDQDEYEELLEEATERKPLSKQKHLRSMSISYETKEVGQSYLDHFPELAEQIWSADDCNKKLHLLRGFFFWLKNLSHNGAYKPWESSGYEVIAADDCEMVVPLDDCEMVVPLDIAIE